MKTKRSTNFKNEYHNSKEVKRIDFNGQKIKLHDNGKLYKYIGLQWRREPLSEFNKYAILARNYYNEPLNQALFDKETLEKLKARKIEVLKENQEREIKIAKRENEIVNDFETAFKNEVTESNLNNIIILLRYLNSFNWGGWSLPRMTVGYSCNQYNCDGKIATTIKLNKAVEGNKLYEYGAPRGHLNNYTPLR